MVNDEQAHSQRHSSLLSSPCLPRSDIARALAVHGPTTTWDIAPPTAASEDLDHDQVDRRRVRLSMVYANQKAGQLEGRIDEQDWYAYLYYGGRGGR